jgi:phage terminase Nu1 subunit (DNA packaging protein)
MPRPSTATGQQLNRTQAARFFGVSLPAVDYWREQGAPHTKQGTAVVFNSKELIEWQVAKAKAEAGRGSTATESIDDLKLRRERAETEMAERKNEVDAGRVVDVTEAEAKVADIVAVLASQHEALPVRFAMPIAHKIAAMLPDPTPDLIEEIRRAVESGLKDCSDEMRNAIAAGEGLPDLFDGDGEPSPLAA